MTNPKVDTDALTDGGRSLKFRVVQAGSWTVLGHFASLAIRLVGTLILTRLYAPEVFGILAIIAAVSIIIFLLTDVGLRQAIIQSPNGGSREFLNTAWTLQVIRGALIWGLGVLVSLGLVFAARWGFLPAGSVYAHPSLPFYIVASSFTAVIMGFQSIKAVTVNRDLDLKRVTLIELASQIVSLAFAIVFGWITQSIWAFIAGGVAGGVLTVLLSHFWLPGPTDKLQLDRKAVRELTKFGRWIFVSSALGTLAMNGDRLLLAGWVSPAILGYYSIGASLANVPEGIAGRIFGAVSLPTLSEILRNQPERFSELYFRMRWVTDTAIAGLAGFLFATGEGIVGLLYDARYSPAGSMLQWLSFSLLFVRYNLAGSAYLALNRPNYITAINVCKLVSLYTLVPLLFYQFGLWGAIIGISLHMLPASLMILFLNQLHGLNSIRIEISVAGIWLLGWVVGWALVNVIK